MIRRIVNWVKGLFTKEEQRLQENGIAPITTTAIAAALTPLEMMSTKDSMAAFGVSAPVSATMTFLGLWFLFAAFSRGKQANMHLALTGRHEPVAPMLWFLGAFCTLMATPTTPVLPAMLFSASLAGIIELWRKFRVHRRSVRIEVVEVMV